MSLGLTSSKPLKNKSKHKKMEKFDGIGSKVNGLPWIKFIKHKLVKDPILGFVTEEDQQEARTNGVIVFQARAWRIPVQ